MPEEKQYKNKSTFSDYAESSDIKYEDLAPNVQGLFDDLSQHFSPGEIVITSGARIVSERSHHFDGGAIDIRPNPKVWNFLVNDPQGIEIMNKRGLNILDESNPTILGKTAGSAPHFHIGGDNSSFVVNMSDRYNKFRSGESVNTISPFSEVYAETNGLSIDYSKPLVYSDEMKQNTFKSLPRYKNDISSYYSGNMDASSEAPSNSNYNGYVFGNKDVTNNNATSTETDRLRKEVEELKKYNQKTDEEEALAKKQEEYISKQHAEMNKKIEILNAYKSLGSNTESMDYENQSIERQKQALSQDSNNNFKLDYSPIDIPNFFYSTSQNQA